VYVYQHAGLNRKEKRRAMKNSKHILTVTIKRMTDDSPDTSWLGEYSNSPISADFSIDRKHSLDCAVNQSHKEAITALERVNKYLCAQFNDNVTGVLCDWYDDGQNFTADLINGLEECDCEERGGMERNEYRYFNPSFNYVTKDGRPKDMTPEDVRKYTRQDYERMEDLNKGEWCFIGIRAEAEYQLAKDGPFQDLTSGGLWGVESDAGREHIAETEKEELSQLREQLTALGFSRRAIAAAFKNVEHKDA